MGGYDHSSYFVAAAVRRVFPVCTKISQHSDGVLVSCDEIFRGNMAKA